MKDEVQYEYIVEDKIRYEYLRVWSNEHMRVWEYELKVSIEIKLADTQVTHYECWMKPCTFNLFEKDINKAKSINYL